MRRKIIVFAALLMMLPLSMDAQRKRGTSKTKAKPKPKVTIIDTEFDERLEDMRGSTQKVMFVDSVVVSKSSLLKSLNIPDEAGSVQPYNDFFNATDQPNAVVYVNQLRNKYVFSKFTDGGWDLYSSEMIGGKWSNAVPLKGLDVIGDDVDINWPFLLADGMTLYFAAKGDDSIGGYDIFMTRYDASTDSYMKPENIGMPFNSTANDYFFIVDEYDGVGWFATDRNQSEDKVCIYAFVLNAVRENYNVEEYSPEQLKQLSELHSISQTWTDLHSRKKALDLLSEISKRKFARIAKTDFVFVINDKHTYTSLKDFRSQDAAARYMQLKELIDKKAKLDSSMEQARAAYSAASQSQKEQLRTQLLAAERQSEKYEREINELTKSVRLLESSKIGR